MRRGFATHDRLVWAGAALFCAAHLAFLPRHLEDIDSINFALGLRDYDVAAHQPHPPGYPVFIVLARAVAAPLSAWLPDDATRAAVAMAILSALAATLALLVLYRLLILLEAQHPNSPDASTGVAAPPTSDAAGRAAWPALAVAATGSAPVFWLTASRPLSDMSGLAGGLLGQWLVLRAGRVGAPLRDGLIAAVVCGLAVGLRSQVTWLVVPLLAWLLVVTWRRRGVPAASAIGASALAGVLIWAVPMVAVTGGPDAYRAAFASQASEDLEGVPMLALQPTPRRAVTALTDTVVAPWAGWPLAAAFGVFAIVGFASLGRHRAHARWILLGALPYAVYHLLFQETETTRYALPLVPPTAVLAMLAARRWTRVLRPVLVVLAVAAFGVSVTAHRQYVTSPVTVQDVLQRLEAAARATGARPQVLMHHRVWAETRRARMALAVAPTYELLPSPRAREWQEALRVWQERRGTAVWWLVDPRRGDRAAVDPRAFELQASVAWPEPVATLLGGMRPHGFDWYRVATPSWVLRGGWGLTPELAGLAAAAGEGPSTTGASAIVWSEASAAGEGTHSLVIGGRHVAVGTAAPVRLAVQVGSGPQGWQQEVDVPPGPFAFMWAVPSQWIPGSTSVSVRAKGPAGRPEAIFLEQFDWQPTPTPVVALERGWYEPERDPVTGRQWRWVGDQSTLRVQPAARAVQMRVTGTYPRHYDRQPVLEVRAGEAVVGRYTLARPFAVSLRVEAPQLHASDGRLSWRVSESFVAGERTGSADARRLALEIATLRIDVVR